jgi:CheY-like chemotaxis protein
MEPNTASFTKTALLVDDEPLSRRANLGRLEAEGYIVSIAQNAAEALGQAKKSLPKIIFLHLAAGGPGTVPFMQALRSDDGCRHIPVVLISDHFDPKVRRAKLHSVNRENW